MILVGCEWSALKVHRFENHFYISRYIHVCLIASYKGIAKPPQRYPKSLTLNSIMVKFDAKP